MPMIMIDGLVEAGEVRATSTFHVDKDNVFVSGGRLREPGLIENIAQTAAAHAGWICKQQHRAAPAGYIAAIRNLEVHELPKVNSRVVTTVEIANHVFDVTIIRGTVTSDSGLLCSCEMRIYIQP